nr:hypothetical protein [Tanacetum cinerariifolium]
MLTYEAKTGAYSFQLDETRFVLDANLLRDALEITPIDQGHQFVSPPLGDTIIDFVNQLGYTEAIHFVSRMTMNNLYQPWRAILSMINQCITGKTSGMIDPDTQIHNIHQRSTSPFHLAKEDLGLEPSQPEPKLKHQGEGDEFDVEQAIHMSLESFQAQIQSHVSGVAIREPVAEATRPLLVVKAKDDASTNIVHESSSPADAETGADTDKTNSRVDTEILRIDEDQRKDEFIEEDQAGPDPEVSRVALVGPNHEPTYEEFMANVYLDVHGSLKLPADEHVILEEPLSLSETLSSMKNLNDAYTFEITLEQKLAAFKQKSKTLDNTTQNLRSRVFTLELRDLPHKIDQTVNTFIKEAIHIALQALIRDHFRELPEADMKEILHQQMFESDSYKSLPEHVALYKALDASMERENRDEFLAKKDKLRKRHHDDQDPPSPPSYSDLSKRRRHDSGASGQKSASHSEQPIEEAPMPDTIDISDSEDTDSAHFSKIKPRQEWLKHILEEDRPETSEPDWSVPPNDLPEPENNWANVLANSFKDPTENKLLRKTGDMGSFITSFCNRIGKKKFSHRLVPDVSKPLALGRPPGQDLYLFHLQGQLNNLSRDDRVHLFNAVNLWIRNTVIRKRIEDLQLRVESYQTKLNLTQLDWDASDFLFKEDYTIVSKPRAVIYKDRNNQKKMMRETEVHMFSDGTLQRILEKPDYMVKDFKLYVYNPSM